MLYQSQLVHMLFFSLSLILLPDSVIMFGLLSFSFFTALRIWFLLVKLTCMVASNGHCHRLTTNPSLVCPSLPPLREVPGLSQRLGSDLMSRKSLCQSSWQRSLTLILNLTVIRVAGNLLEVHLLVKLTPIQRGFMGDGIPDMLQCLTSSP